MEQDQRSNDAWDASLYDAKHSFVSAFGRELIDLLAVCQGEHILDLGCGTGDLTQRLAELGAEVIGIDMSENMIQAARTKYPQLDFQVVDALELSHCGAFDAVFSNATLHWIQPPEQVAARIFRSLKVGGRLVAEFGGQGNVQTIVDEILRQRAVLGQDLPLSSLPWYYPSIGQYASLLEMTGFRVTSAQHFARPTPLEGKDGLRNWIEMFGAALLAGLSAAAVAQVIANVERNLAGVLYNAHSDAWLADYRRIRVVAVKEHG